MGKTKSYKKVALGDIAGDVRIVPEWRIVDGVVEDDRPVVSVWVVLESVDGKFKTRLWVGDGVVPDGSESMAAQIALRAVGEYLGDRELGWWRGVEVRVRRAE